MDSLCLPVAEVIFNDTARCKILIDAIKTPRLTWHENYGKHRAIHQFKKLSQNILTYFGHVPNHLKIDGNLKINVY